MLLLVLLVQVLKDIKVDKVHSDIKEDKVLLVHKVIKEFKVLVV